ncbi:MAG: Gfo/Idh/MocA family oxidoreductase [Opitutae bacterium]|nr:Gfo/Idh/MocA family oxidoreductase [Opitutae bacterium]
MSIRSACAQSQEKVTHEGTTSFRVAIVGLVHGHVRGVPARFKNQPGFELVGIAEPDARIAKAFAGRNGLDMGLLYADVDEMLRKTSPHAVMVFTNTYDHRKVVEACARYGVSVMVEKPLATTFADAQAIKSVAEKTGIHVLVNYETTWYPSNVAAYDLIHGKVIGDVTKIIVNDGHGGPKEGGVDPDFLRWLRDPELNGGGALFDFGCYGASLSTWLLDGQRPRKVTAITQQLKPESYPLVDDDCTVILAYDKAQTIIQASWNWPFPRKDLEVYGQAGYVIVPNPGELRIRAGTEKVEQSVKSPALKPPNHDPMAHLRAVVLDGATPNELSSLDTNVLVVEILDAARRSAASGRTVELPRVP